MVKIKDVLHPLHPIYSIVFYFPFHLSLFFRSLSVSSICPFQRSETEDTIASAKPQFQLKAPFPFSLNHSLYAITLQRSSQINILLFQLVYRSIVYLSLSIHNHRYTKGFLLFLLRCFSKMHWRRRSLCVLKPIENSPAI